MNKIFAGPIGLVLLMGLLTLMGCSKESSPKPAAETKVFESASAGNKADWEKIMTAVKSNDYTTAVLTCKKLQTTGELTPEQAAAVNDTMTAVISQMNMAAQKGDANATKAVAEIRKNWRPTAPGR